MHMPRTGLVFTALMLVAAPAHAVVVMQGAPQGFEQLTAPRPTRITLSYGGDVLGAFAAHFTPTEVMFDDPATIIAALPSAKHKDRLRDTLSHPMLHNAHALCTEKRRKGCGMLTPKTAAIIFDENRLSAELFLNKRYLAVGNKESRYLPLPKERALSSVYAFTGAIAGADDDMNFNGTLDSTYAYGEAKFVSQSSMSNEGLRFDTAAASIEREGWNATGGLFRSRPMQLIGDRDIAGVSFSSSTRTLLDRHKTEGNDIILYLPRRAYVSLYREGRLYSARAYEAGNQKIDTSELPEGAYTVTLRIQEADGGTREEQRFFAKSEEMPADGEPLYYAQAGFLREPASADSTMPAITGDPLLRAGIIARASDDIGVSAGMLGLADRAALEAGAFWLGPGMQLRATAMGSTKGDAGLQASYIYTDQRLSAAIDARQVWMSSEAMAGYDELIGDITQATAIVAYALTPEVTVGARASYSKQMNFDTMSAGPYAEWRVWQEGESMLGISASAARNDGRNEGNLLLSFSHRFGAARDYGISGAAGGGYGGDSRGPNGNMRVFHDRYTPGESLRLGAGTSVDARNRIISADGDWRGAMGQLQGSVQRSMGDSNVTAYAANIAMNAAMSEEGIHVGGNDNERSAVLIALSGDADAEMRILVNDTERATVKVGEKQAIYLSPFHSYRIRIKPMGDSLLDYDNAETKVTLYPGNVQTLHYNVERFYVISARIVDEAGAPLTDALLIESKQSVSTDAKGRLQAEIANSRRLSFTRDGVKCSVTLPEKDSVNGVLLYKEPLSCKLSN